ncbi:glutathione S-transferase family protein [Maricurvus nonylphenolicus]|uniref:glutathione S-transferase family protein n=1 Tax=Maricurvus nonylphenolicus TaxID=1008307 RepID=UPI0036F2E9E3
MTIKVWHTHQARSMRVLWALEEMGLDYEVISMAFPPRFTQPEYLEINELGTIPYMIDGDTHMTESCGIPLYLVERYGKHEFGLKPDHPEYGDYLNWLFHSDATLTFPQTVYIRYTLQEPPERGLQEAATDYMKWFHARLRKLNKHLEDGREYLVDNRFTVADITIAYALFLGENLKIDERYKPQVRDYLNRMKERPAFQKVAKIGEEFTQITK